MKKLGKSSVKFKRSLPTESDALRKCKHFLLLLLSTETVFYRFLTFFSFASRSSEARAWKDLSAECMHFEINAVIGTKITSDTFTQTFLMLFHFYHYFSKLDTSITFLRVNNSTANEGKVLLEKSPLCDKEKHKAGSMSSLSSLSRANKVCAFFSQMRINVPVSKGKVRALDNRQQQRFRSFYAVDDCINSHVISSRSYDHHDSLKRFFTRFVDCLACFYRRRLTMLESLLTLILNSI